MTTFKTPPSSLHLTEPPARWSIQKINDWYDNIKWPIGCNYLPHNAINQLEMWQAETFSPIVIDRELSWAASLGFNTVRVFLHDLLWQQDSEGFLNRIDTFLSIAAKHGIKPMMVLFDGVWDPFPKVGRQPDPKTYIHNSGWVQSPGFDVLNDVSRHDEMFDYVNGVISHFKNDERILVWDLFNEPDNINTGSYKDDYYVRQKADLALQLLFKTVLWVRAINPIQPITMAPWQTDWADVAAISLLDQYMFMNADIISFHCYEKVAGMEQRIMNLKRYKRPMLCTEYMARPLESTFADILPILKKHKVGGYSWGLVAGKSQTHCAWDSWHTTAETEPECWFHDIFKPDGTPYLQAEVDYLKDFITSPRKKNKAALAKA